MTWRISQAESGVASIPDTNPFPFTSSLTYAVTTSPFGGAVFGAGFVSSGSIVRKSSNMLYNSGNLISLTGPIGVPLKRLFSDLNNVKFVNELEFFQENPNTSDLFKYDPFTVHPLLYPQFNVSISASSENFDKTSFSIKFSDDLGTLSSVDIAQLGMYTSSSIPGWVNFSYNFYISGNIVNPLMSFAGLTSSLILSCSAAKTYSFLNPVLSFKEPLTDSGVRYYGTLDNQNNSEIFNYIKYRTAKKVE